MARIAPEVLAQTERRLRNIKLASAFLIATWLTLAVILAIAFSLNLLRWSTARAVVVIGGLPAATVVYWLWARAFLVRTRNVVVKLRESE